MKAGGKMWRGRVGFNLKAYLFCYTLFATRTIYCKPEFESLNIVSNVTKRKYRHRRVLHQHLLPFGFNQRNVENSSRALATLANLEFKTQNAEMRVFS